METREPEGLPWLPKELRQRLKPHVRKLYEEYVGLPPDEVEAHIVTIRDKSFREYPYPCVGQFGFLHLIVPRFPWDEGILEKLKAGGTILDVGCGFGQDLRLLAFEGVPITAMRATDNAAGIWDLGLELFKDKEKFEGKFVAKDLLNETETSQSSFLSQVYDVILANQLFHLFDWESQVKLGKNLVKMSKPDTWITGYQIGIETARSFPNMVRGDGESSLGGTSCFIHDEESWERLWQEIGEVTHTKWRIQSRLVDLKGWGLRMRIKSGGPGQKVMSSAATG